MTNEELYHHGILGQKWGVRRYQNPDGTLTPEGRARLEKKDTKWAKKNYDKIYSKSYKRSKRDLSSYNKKVLSKNYKKNSAAYINAYNKKMAELMTKSASDISAPSGRVIKFVAKRGELGVHMALADQNYDMSKYRNGIWEDGRIAYKKNKVDVR